MATTMRTARAISGRHGFSLMEMIVVLVLLGSLLAMVAPSLFRPLGKAEVRDAAKQVQAALMDARTRAIESGVIHEFRYEPGGSRYEIRALGDAGDIAATEDTGSTGQIGSAAQPLSASQPGSTEETSLPAAASLSLEPVIETLPNEIVFKDLQNEAASEPPVAADALSARDSLTALEEELSGTTWSAGIRFYSNGRSRNAHIRLVAPKDWSIDILLRGITGAALLGDPRHEETDQNNLASPSWPADRAADSP
jgi:prepilin-type N-terminal cleavage/methylation domain-containing protein